MRDIPLLPPLNGVDACKKVASLVTFRRGKEKKRGVERQNYTAIYSPLCTVSSLSGSFAPLNHLPEGVATPSLSRERSLPKFTSP